MDDIPSSPRGPKPHVPAVEPDLLASALFLFGEYLSGLDEPNDDPEAEEIEEDEDDEDEDGEGPPIDTKEVLDLFAEELGTNVPTTLAVYMRVTALFRLLSASPALAQLAMVGEDFGGALTDEALIAAARLDLHVTKPGAEAAAEFDAREFREALNEA